MAKADYTTVSFAGPGPFALPELSAISVSILDDGKFQIKGRIPVMADGIERFVEVPLSQGTAMQLLALLERWRIELGLKVATGPIRDTNFQR